MENLALRRGDAAIARQGPPRQLIRSNYLKTFYEPAAGYLYSSLTRGREIDSNPHEPSATLGMDFATAFPATSAPGRNRGLIRAANSIILRTQRRRLHDPAHEMWRSDHVQHIAHEMRTGVAPASAMKSSE